MVHKPLNFEQISKLIAKGVGQTKYKKAFANANYIGNPGKDIFFWIESDPSPSNEQMDIIKRGVEEIIPEDE